MARAIWWTMWMTVLAALWFGTAEAGEPSAQRAYRRATAVALGGGIATVVGAPLAIGGLATAIAGPRDTPPAQYALGMTMYVGGLTAFGSGGALLAGGSLAGRRVLARHGVRVSAVPGALAWGTWGLSAATFFVLPAFVDFPGAEWVALSSCVATVALGTTQLVLNHKALRRLHEQAHEGPQRIALGAAPMVAPDRVGASLVVSF